jgi:predicted DNA-binding ribbon-helix-helix protein
MPESESRKVNLRSIATRTVVVRGHRTSVRLEPAMWEALRDIARQQDRSVSELVTEIDQGHPDLMSLTSAIRVYVVEYYRAAAVERPERSPHARLRRK